VRRGLAQPLRSKPVLAFHTPGHVLEQALQVLVDGVWPRAVASGRRYAVGQRGDGLDAAVRIHQLHAVDVGQLQVQVVPLADEVRPGRRVFQRCRWPARGQVGLQGLRPRHLAMLAALAHHVQHPAAVTLRQRRDPFQAVASRGHLDAHPGKEMGGGVAGGAQPIEQAVQDHERLLLG
jgi:hypothetical protein